MAFPTDRGAKAGPGADRRPPTTAQVRRPVGRGWVGRSRPGPRPGSRRFCSAVCQRRCDVPLRQATHGAPSIQRARSPRPSERRRSDRGAALIRRPSAGPKCCAGHRPPGRPDARVMAPLGDSATPPNNGHRHSSFSSIPPRPARPTAGGPQVLGSAGWPVGLARCFDHSPVGSGRWPRDRAVGLVLSAPTPTARRIPAPRRLSEMRTRLVGAGATRP